MGIQKPALQLGGHCVGEFVAHPVSLVRAIDARRLQPDTV